MHDADVGRMTGGADRRSVARLSLGELSRLRLGADGERSPSLDEVLDWARGRVAVNVEAKHDVPDRLVLARGIAAAIARHRDVEVLVSSFDPPLLAMLAALAPHVPRAWLTHEGQRRWEPLWSRAVIRAPITAVHLQRTLADPETVETLRSAGKRVGVWTVNDPREARDLAALGVDWLITDAPAALSHT
jgi:glycerophosphoryl diester phosphodiesterase